MNAHTSIARAVRRSNIEDRVAVLERDMQIVKADISCVKTDIETVKGHTEEILAALTTAKGVAAFVKKYGPKALTFIGGIMTAAGIGNPKIWAFISGFFA